MMFAWAVIAKRYIMTAIPAIMSQSSILTRAVTLNVPDTTKGTLRIESFLKNNNYKVK